MKDVPNLPKKVIEFRPKKKTAKRFIANDSKTPVVCLFPHMSIPELQMLAASIVGWLC